MPNLAEKRSHGSAAAAGNVVRVVSSTSVPVSKLVSPSRSARNGAPRVYHEVPHVDGYYLFQSGETVQPAEVVYRNGLYVYRLFNGHQSSALLQGQSLEGPYLGAELFSKSNPVALVSDAVPRLSPEEMSELELDSCYGEIAQLETRLSDALKEQKHSVSRDRFDAVSAQLTKVLDELEMNKQRASVAEEEYETVVAERDEAVSKLGALPSKLSGSSQSKMSAELKTIKAELKEAQEKLKQSEESMSSVAAEQKSEPEVRGLPESVSSILRGIQSLLIQTKQYVDSPAGKGAIDDLMDRIDQVF